MNTRVDLSRLGEGQFGALATPRRVGATLINVAFARETLGASVTELTAGDLLKSVRW